MVDRLSLAQLVGLLEQNKCTVLDMAVGQTFLSAAVARCRTPPPGAPSRCSPANLCTVLCCLADIGRTFLVVSVVKLFAPCNVSHLVTLTVDQLASL